MKNRLDLRIKGIKEIRIKDFQAKILFMKISAYENVEFHQQKR